MATQQTLYGLKALYMGPLAGDGGPGTGLTLVGNAVIDTPVLTTAEGTTTEFNIEQSDFAYFTKKTPGATTLTLSLYGLSPETLLFHFGGSITPGATSADPAKWNSPDSFDNAERTIVLEQSQGGYVQLNRVNVSATFEWNFKKNDLPKINISGSVLKPVKSGVKVMVFDQAAYTP